jgi:hypothetical protein
MIKYIDNFLNNEEIHYFIDVFRNKQMGTGGFRNDNLYRYYYVDLMNKNLGVKKFSKFKFSKFRVQMVNETINQIEIPHAHKDPWSFVIFLNEDFIGGEIVFDNVSYTPKTGDMLYFSGDEFHKVNNCVGDRYTLIGFMLNNPLEIITPTTIL